ncbi:MAG: response regulator [bacterium]|nr:response regulator [bacterium]
MFEKKILIVEDDEPIRDLYVKVFSDNGFDVFFAKTGEEALEILEDEDIPVMFIDINIPGMSGIELAKEILKKKKNVMMHAVTGYVGTFTQDECLDAGFEEFFIKPVAMNELLMTANHALDELNKRNKQ